MSLEIVSSNSLLLCRPWYKKAHIQHCPELTDGVVMALLAPWRGYIEGIHKKMTVEEEVKDSVTVMGSGWRIAA